MNEILYAGGFYFLAVIAVAASILVAFSRNPLVSALYLALVFIASSGLFVYLEAHFLAFIQVIIYAGAIVVLFIYVIMLLDLSPERIKGTYGALAKIIGSVFMASLIIVFMLNMAGFSKEGFGPLDVSYGTTAGLANELFSIYVVPFELVSIVLLVGIIGGVMLVKKVEKKKEESA